MSSKKSPTKDGSRGSSEAQQRDGAISVSPEHQSEELPGAEDETDEDLDDEMDDEDDEEISGDEGRTVSQRGDGDEFEVDGQSASRDAGSRGEGDRGRGDESSSDGKE